MSEVTDWAPTAAGNAVAFDDIDGRDGRPRPQGKLNNRAIMAAVRRFADLGRSLISNITTASGVTSLYPGEQINVTNQTNTGHYSVRFAALTKTGVMTTGVNDIGDTLILRYNDVRSGSAWGRWNVMQSPLNPASGLPTAPGAAQAFNFVIAEENPQNRHGDVDWAGESRRFANGVGGVQMVAETQDFTSLLPTGSRIGYNISFGYLVSRSPYTNSISQRHAQFLNGLLYGVNSISPDGAAIFANGYKSFPTAVAIASGGTGYAVGNLLTFNTGLSDNANESTILRVKAVNGSGVITSIEIYNAGSYLQTFATPIGVTGGSGSGATFTYTLSTDAEAPRAFAGVVGTWDYAIDAAAWNAPFSNTGGGRFLGGMIRSGNNTNIIVSRNAADSADVAGLKYNASDKWEVAGAVVEPWQTWTPTFTADSGSFTTVTVSRARWSRVNNKVTIELSFTITTVGTAAGAIRFSHPVAPVGTPAVSGMNATAGLALIGTHNGTVFRLVRYDNANPIVAGNAYNVSFTYEVAP
jgi:hypothetical protein